MSISRARKNSPVAREAATGTSRAREHRHDRPRRLEKRRLPPRHPLPLARHRHVSRDDVRRHARRIRTAERERLAYETLRSKPRGAPSQERFADSRERVRARASSADPTAIQLTWAPPSPCTSTTVGPLPPKSA